MRIVLIQWLVCQPAPPFFFGAVVTPALSSHPLDTGAVLTASRPNALFSFSFPSRKTCSNPASIDVITGSDSLAVREIAAEHAALTRQLAGMQRRVSEQMQASAQRVRALEGDVVQLRAQLIVARTCLLWGLSTTGAMRPLARRARAAAAAVDTAAMAEASSVICQTACVGHAHPWLEADGQCRRTGTVCERSVPTPD